MRSYSFFYTILLIAVFVPFLNVFFFVGTETSPFAGILCLSFALLLVYSKKCLTTITFPGFLLLFFIILSLFQFRFYEYLDAVYYAHFLRIFFSILFGFSVFFVISRLTISDLLMMSSKIRYFIALWLVVGFLQLSPLSEYIKVVFEIIMTRSIGGGEGGARGINLLANEPSYAGIYLVCFLIILDFLKLIQRNLRLYPLYIIIVFMILMTKSANSLLLLVFYFLLVFSLNITVKKITYLLVLIVFFISVFSNIEMLGFNSRALNVVDIIVENPSFLLEDQSIASRYYFIILSYYGMIQSYFMGFGVGSYGILWMEHAEHLGVTQVYEIKNAWGKVLMPMSFLGGIGHDFGLIGLVFFIFFIFYPLLKVKNRDSKKYIFVSSFFIFLLWAQTCSYSLPLPWFIVALNYVLVKYESKKAIYGPLTHKKGSSCLL